MLGVDRLADRRPHQVKMLVARACNVTVTVIAEVLLDDGNDLILAKTTPFPGGVPQEEGRGQPHLHVEISDATNELGQLIVGHDCPAVAPNCQRHSAIARMLLRFRCTRSSTYSTLASGRKWCRPSGVLVF